MEIKEVIFNPHDKDDPSKIGAKDDFKILWTDGSASHVPIETTNRFYWEVREWYFKQPKKPFDFDFEPLPTGE